MDHHQSSETRRLVWSGVFWNSLYQVFATLLSFGTMLILVRIIPPSEYGKWAATVGILTVINSFNARNFIAQALQEPEGREPDWSLHWTAAFYVQTALFLLCHLIALATWWIPGYRPLAPLLHIAAFGLLFDWANQLRGTMLRREMDFRRFRLVYGLGTLASTGVTLVLGVMGCGAYAMIIGGNVIAAMPFAVDLLWIRRWRPKSDWWRWPDWPAYTPAIRFGLQQMASALLSSARTGLESMVLPGCLGFTAIGLLNRSQALFSTTVGRVNDTLMETVYPLLPRSAPDANRFSRHGTLFAQFILLIALPGALFLGLEGPAMVRVVYGQKWIAVDPLIWPAAILGLSAAVTAVSQNIFLAANRLRACFLLNLLSAILSLPAIGMAVAGRGLVSYAWTLSVGQFLCASVSLAGILSVVGRAGVRQALCRRPRAVFLRRWRYLP